MNDTTKKTGGFFARILGRLTASGESGMAADAVELGAEKSDESSANERLRIIEEYDEIKANPDYITGWDFDRAFEFLEKHPDSEYAVRLKEEMYGTNTSTLKGLSYGSAVKVLQRMPDHPGVESIVNGMRKVESDYLAELKSDVVSYMLEIIPDHPIKEELAAALAQKNLTNAYEFVERLPEHPCTRLVIEAMFARDPNIAILLLHERMDHPQVEAIFNGIYSIDLDGARKLMPDAILFIFDVAHDHPLIDRLIIILVEKNYTRAFDFIKRHPENHLTQKIADALCEAKPDLAPLVAKALA